MKAWVVRGPGSLELAEHEVPAPGKHEILIAIATCGVCRTDLHIVEGDLEVHRPGVVPGHEIVGVIAELGTGASRFRVGDRVGIAWLRYTCGGCIYCTTGRENLCESARFTGWDEDGGYAQYAVVHEDFAYSIPDAFDDEHAAPLLCAGIIGYRALRRSNLPRGGALGIYGYGGSAHLAAQVALHEGARVHVVTRSGNARALALELGAASAHPYGAELSEPLDAAVLFAPSGEIVPQALEALRPGARLAVAGIHLTPIPELDYERHLFRERELVSVTANTRSDGEEFLSVAARIPIRVSVTPYKLDEADAALEALSKGRVRGAAVLHAHGP